MRTFSIADPQEQLASATAIGEELAPIFAHIAEGADEVWCAGVQYGPEQYGLELTLEKTLDDAVETVRTLHVLETCHDEDEVSAAAQLIRAHCDSAGVAFVAVGG